MKKSNRKNNTAMRLAAGAMSVLTVAAYTVPANVGGFLTGSNGLVAHAEPNPEPGEQEEVQVDFVEVTPEMVAPETAITVDDIGVCTEAEAKAWFAENYEMLEVTVEEGHFYLFIINDGESIRCFEFTDVDFVAMNQEEFINSIQFTELIATDTTMLIDQLAEYVYDENNTAFIAASTKAAPTVTDPTAVEDLAYTGQPQELINEGSTTGGTLVYAVTTGDSEPADNAWLETIPTAAEIGDYTVWYKVIGDEEYKGTEPQSISVSIGKAEAEITAPVLNSTYYTGEDIKVIKTGGSAKGVQTGTDELEQPVFENVPLEYAIINAEDLDTEMEFVEELEWISDISAIKVKDEGTYVLFWRVADEKYKIGTVEGEELLESYANGFALVDVEVKEANIVLSNLDTSTKPAVFVKDGTALEPGETGYSITGGTYYIYTDKTIANTTLANGTKLFKALNVTQSTDETFNNVSYNYCYTIKVPQVPENGYLITHTNSFTGKVPTEQEDTLYVTEDTELLGDLAAVLKSTGVYYYGDTPDKDECVEITPGFENIVESVDAYFTNEEGHKIANNALEYGTQYYLTAKVTVDEDGEPGGKSNTLYIRRPIEYKPRPLYLCDFYLDAADTEGEYDGELNIPADEPSEGVVYDTKLSVEEIDNDGEKYYNIDIPEGTFVYNEEEQAPKIFIVNKANREVLGVATAAEFAEMTDDEKAAVSCIDGVEAQTAQGNYSFAIVANDNCNYTDDVTVNWSIAKKPLLGITIVPKEGIIYNGEELDLDDFVFSGNDVDVLDEEGTECTISFAKEIDGDIFGTDGKSAGEHTAYITITSENFSTRTFSVPVTIGKRPITVTPVQEDYVYGTEEAPNITYTVNMAATDDEGKYADSGENAKGFIDGEEIDFSKSFKIKDFNTTTFKNNAGDYEYEASTPVAASATGEKQIGEITDATSGYIPVYMWFNNSYSAQIYTASEIGGISEINNIAFNLKYAGSAQTGKFRIYLMDTELDHFESEESGLFAYEDMTPLCTIEDYQPVIGWNQFDFDSTYEHDPEKNLIVIAVKEATDCPSGYQFSTYATENCTSIVARSDNYTDIRIMGRISCNYKNVIKLNVGIEGEPGQLDPIYNYDNYDITIDPDAVFTVSKKPLTQDMFFTESPDSYTYTGEEIAAPSYYISEDEVWSDETPMLTWEDIDLGGTQTAILPGNFTVEAAAAEDGNYTGFVSYKWSVIGDTSFSTAVSAEGKTYDGKAIDTPEIFYFYDGDITDNVPKNAKVTYTYYKVDLFPEDITDETVAGLQGTTVAPKDAGKYIVKASVKAKGYTIPDSYNAFVIDQKELVITPTITGKQYGEADPKFEFNDLSDLIADGDDVKFTGSYAIGDKLTLEAADSVPYDGSVGIYDFNIGDLAIDSDNYFLTIDEEALFTVTTRDITDEDIFVIAPAYTGEDGWATIKGGENGNYVVKVVIDGTETVLEENVDYVVINAPKTMNVGDYYIQIKGINNFSDVAEAAVEVRADSVVLTPGAPSVTINPANNQLYVYVSYTAATKNGFEILEHNIIYCNDGSVKDASELKIDKVNDENIKIVSGRRGTNLRDFGKDVVAVGCAKVKNPEGEISYLYTDNIGYKGVTIGETTPSAVLNPNNNDEYVHVYFSCTVNSSDYTVEGKGLFYCNNGAVSAEELEAMTVEEAEANANVTVIPNKSGTNIRDFGDGVVAVGYEVVKNTSGQIGYIYTKNIGGSYADLA